MVFSLEKWTHKTNLIPVFLDGSAQTLVGNRGDRADLLRTVGAGAKLFREGQQLLLLITFGTETVPATDRYDWILFLVEHINFYQISKPSTASCSNPLQMVHLYCSGTVASSIKFAAKTTEIVIYQL
jgi:hypothetical protein